MRGLAAPQQTTQSDADEIAEAVVKKLRDSVVDTKVQTTRTDKWRRSLNPIGSRFWKPPLTSR
jgi:hypothetical protein